MLILILSITAIQAKEDTQLNTTKEVTEEFFIENTTSNDQLKSTIGEGLSDVEESSNEAVKNQTALNSQSSNVYYKGEYKVTLMDSNATAPITGKPVIFTINNANHSIITDNDGLASIKLDLTPGQYTIDAFFTGDSQHEESRLTATVNVLSTVRASDITKYYKGSAQYTATLWDSQGKALANRNVAIILNGKTYTKKTNNNGVVSMPVNLKPGNYKITITDPLTGYKVTTNYRILSTISADNLQILKKDSKKFTAKFYKSNGKVLAKKWIKFKLKGKIYKVKTNKNGVAGLSLKKLKKGTYNIISYNRDGLTKTNTVKVYSNKATTKLSTNAYIFLLSESKQIKVKYSTSWGGDSNHGKTVKIKVNGHTYSTKTDANGMVILKLPSLNKGLYTVTYSYAGNKYFKSSKATNLLTVLDNTSTQLTVKSTTHFGYGAGTPLKILYSTVDGVPLAKKTVTFTINGKNYAKTTDNNGIASLPITLGIGTYTVYYKTGDDSKVTGSEGSCVIDVFKRTTTKLTWKSASTFKDSSQIFKVLFTDSNGNPVKGKTVKLIIDGESYTDKTDSKGIATFKTYVAIGAYKVSFSFDGNNNYLPSKNSKSVNVKLSYFKNGVNQKNTVSYLRAFLKSSSHCKVGNAKIKKLVKSLTKGLTSKTDKAKALYNWVRDNLAYSYYYNTKYGAVKTLKLKKGNCVDHSHLLVSMFRTAGLKARYVHGVCTFSDGDRTGHVWTQVLIGKHWVVADATSYRNSLGKIKNWNTKTVHLHTKYSSLPF